MNKMILTAVVVALTATAQAGSVEKSVNGSGKMSSGVIGSSATTVKVVVNGIASAVSATGKGISSAATAARDGLVFVLENPSQASKNSFNASGKASTWALTTSGELVLLVRDGSVAFLMHPIESTKNASSTVGRASSTAYRVTVDASGRVLSASGQSISNTYGKDTELVLDGAGDIYQVGAGSVVASYNSGKASVQIVGETLIDSVATSVAASGDSASALSQGDVYASVMAILNMPADAFAASVAPEYQNKLAK